MLIDCDSCRMRDIGCADCVVGVLITGHNAPAADPAAVPAEQPGDASRPEIGEQERRALRTLASAGLVPPLRLVMPDPEHIATAGDHPAGLPDAEAS